MSCDCDLFGKELIIFSKKKTFLTSLFTKCIFQFMSYIASHEVREIFTFFLLKSAFIKEFLLSKRVALNRNSHFSFLCSQTCILLLLPPSFHFHYIQHFIYCELKNEALNWKVYKTRIIMMDVIYTYYVLVHFYDD